MKPDYLYQSPGEFDQPTTAIIVLPEIFGITSFIRSVADNFAKELSVPAYALDFFYQLNHTPNEFSYEPDMQKGVELMQQMKGEDFVTIFDTAVSHIVQTQPSIKSLSICGFCFGGRLAYVAGLSAMVKNVLSFYGAGANMPGYINDRSPIEALTDARPRDDQFSVLSFYGGQDESIPPQDRAMTKKLLAEASISYEEVVYEDAGHAFFNHDRAHMYNQSAAEQSWQKIQTFLS